MDFFRKFISILFSLHKEVKYSNYIKSYRSSTSFFYVMMSLCNNQGWKLQTVRLSGTGKNGGGQVKNLDNCPKERLKFWHILYICCRGQAKNSAGQVDPWDACPKDRLNYFVISTPEQSRWWQSTKRFLQDSYVHESNKRKTINTSETWGDK